MTGDNVRRLRYARNLTQQDLAGLARLSLHTVMRCERGRPMSRRTLQQIADALDVELADVLDEGVPA